MLFFMWCKRASVPFFMWCKRMRKKRMYSCPLPGITSTWWIQRCLFHNSSSSLGITVVKSNWYWVLLFGGRRVVCISYIKFEWLKQQHRFLLPNLAVLCYLKATHDIGHWVMDYVARTLQKYWRVRVRYTKVVHIWSTQHRCSNIFGES